MDTANSDKWLTLTQAVAATGVSKTTLRKWVKRGKLDHREIQGPSGVAWEVPEAQVWALVEAMPRTDADEASLPVLRSTMEDALASFHALAEDLSAAREAAGAATARAAALEAEAERLRTEAAARLEAEKAAAVAQAEVERLREAAATAVAAEQRAVLAEAEAQRLRDEMERLAHPAPAGRHWWGGKRKAQ